MGGHHFIGHYLPPHSQGASIHLHLLYFQKYYLTDKDWVAMLKRMYGGEDGPTKKELMEYGDLLTNFFGWEENGKDVWEADDDYSWAMLDW